MNKIFEQSLTKFLNILEKDENCLGCWHWGAVSKGLDDYYSDSDLIVLIDGNNFTTFDEMLPAYFNDVFKNIILYWPEPFNNDFVLNYNVHIEINARTFVIDIMLLNDLKRDNWAFRIHTTDLLVKNIIFDKNNIVADIAENSPKNEIASKNIPYIIDTYWHNINLTTKYFIRGDYFQILNKIHSLMNTHTELLLSQYDNIRWGAWFNKLKYMPAEKQEHLKLYYTFSDFDTMKKNLKISIDRFSKDAQEICSIKNLTYPISAETSLKKEFADL